MSAETRGLKGLGSALGISLHIPPFGLQTCSPPPAKGRCLSTLAMHKAPPLFVQQQNGAELSPYAVSQEASAPMHCQSASSSVLQTQLPLQQSLCDREKGCPGPGMCQVCLSKVALSLAKTKNLQMQDVQGRLQQLQLSLNQIRLQPFL